MRVPWTGCEQLRNTWCKSTAGAQFCLFYYMLGAFDLRRGERIQQLDIVSKHGLINHGIPVRNLEMPYEPRQKVKALSSEDSLTLAEWAILLEAPDDFLRELRDHGASLVLALVTTAETVLLPQGYRNERVRFLLSLGAKPSALSGVGGLSLVMEYWLKRAESGTDFKKRMQHIDRLQRVADLVNLPTLPRLPELFFALVGQQPATHAVVNKVTGWAFRLPKSPKPLVLMLCGPSGHGKTELAHKLADLIAGGGEHFHKVPCDQMKTATEIFGLGGAYQGAGEGSELNNFVSRHDRKPAVILLDEIEKADRKVHESFLNIWDRGEWVDKKLKYGDSSQTHGVDCSRMLFIMTTNAFDDQVFDLAAKNKRMLSGSDPGHLLEMWDTQLRKRAQTRFSPYFSGRVDAFIPFLPFDRKDEIPVMIDSALGDAIDFHADERKNLQTSIKILVQDHAAFATYAEQFFNAKEGARSVRRTIARSISDPVENLWACGDLALKESYVKMSVNTEELLIAFRPLSTPCVKGVLAIQYIVRVEDSAELREVCDALGYPYSNETDKDGRLTVGPVGESVQVLLTLKNSSRVPNRDITCGDSAVPSPPA